MGYLVDIIGKPAMLEQTAEEATELAKACLKLARFMRDENKVHGKSEADLYNDLAEEMADVLICFDELYLRNNNSRGIISNSLVIDWEAKKFRRMEERLKYYVEKRKTD